MTPNSMALIMVKKSIALSLVEYKCQGIQGNLKFIIYTQSFICNIFAIFE